MASYRHKDQPRRVGECDEDNIVKMVLLGDVSWKIIVFVESQKI